jgi:hypothetical protein
MNEREEILSLVKLPTGYPVRVAYERLVEVCLGLELRIRMIEEEKKK